MDCLGSRARIGAVVLAAATWAAAPAQAGNVEPGKGVYKSANCIGCHKWHGGGGGGYGGAALSLRETTLDRAALVEVVRCGRPATGMPFHDRNAYRTTDCYGMTRAQVGADLPPAAAGYLREHEIEAVVDYVTLRIQGKGAPNEAECTAFWGAESRECQGME